MLVRIRVPVKIFSLQGWYLSCEPPQRFILSPPHLWSPRTPPSAFVSPSSAQGIVGEANRFRI